MASCACCAALLEQPETNEAMLALACSSGFPVMLGKQEWGRLSRMEKLSRHLWCTECIAEAYIDATA